jgi:hypothetical protein
MNSRAHPTPPVTGRGALCRATGARARSAAGQVLHGLLDTDHILLNVLQVNGPVTI